MIQRDTFTDMNISNYYKKIKIVATTFLTLYLMIWAISSPVSKHFIKPILLEQGLTLATDTSISYNPFLSQLTISDLTLYKDKQETVLSINKLAVRLTLFQLLFDKIIISKFELTDAYLKIEKNPTQLIVAGVDLNKENSNSITEKTTATEPTPFPYQLVLPKLALNKVNIDINNNKKFHQISIEALLISQVIASQQSQQATIELQSVIDNAELALTADAVFGQGQGEINSKLALTAYPIEKSHAYMSELSELSGSLSFISEQQVTIAPDQFTFNISKAKLNNNDLIVGYQQQFLNLEKLENSIKDLKVIFSQGEITELSGMSQLTLTNADIYHEKSSQKLAHFEQLTLNDINLHLNDLPQVKIASIVMDEFVGSNNEESDLPPLLTLKQFKISDLLVNEQQLIINKITLDSLKSVVIIDKEKALANLVTLPLTKTKKEDVAEITTEIAQDTQAKKTNFIVSLNEFSLINDNQIAFLDNSVFPVYQRNFYLDTLDIGAISNAKDKQDQHTPFELIGRSNKYAHFNFTGFVQPFSQKPSHHVEGFLKELSLPAISTYMKQAMQMELKSGQLNTNIDVTLTGEQLDGNVVILLQGLETAIADSNEAGALIDQGALPFNMALGMLKDGNGDVNLNVPLSGSTSDPQFGMSSIVTLITQKAIWMATQDYLMTTFVPYANIVSVAMKVGEFALKLRFDDLIYQVKQIAPNEDQQSYLQAFIALMQDKKSTRVNICAISTPEDIGLVTGSAVTDPNDIERLKTIANERELALKDYVIEHGQIESSRLLLCAPQIDSSKGAVPRIALSV